MFTLSSLIHINNMQSKKKVANYVVELSNVLGAGQYGRVCRAVDKRTDTVVAAKIIDKRQGKKIVYVVSDDDYTKNALVREI